MSQPRRRRRRRRRTGESGGANGRQRPAEQGGSQAQGTPQSDSRRSRRRRRGRGGGGGGGRERVDVSPKSSEDLVRALPRERPEALTAPADGQTLEELIGSLQSTWGVPQYPQEFRITLKVVEEREARTPPAAAHPLPTPAADGQPRREKAPAAPRIRAGAPGGDRRDAPAGAKRRRRGRRRRRGGGNGGAGAPEAGPGG